MTAWIKTTERKPDEVAVDIWSESERVLMWVVDAGFKPYATIGRFRNGMACPETFHGDCTDIVPMWAPIVPPEAS